MTDFISWSEFNIPIALLKGSDSKLKILSSYLMITLKDLVVYLFNNEENT